MDAGGTSLLACEEALEEASMDPTALPCRCVWLDNYGQVLLPNRLCFPTAGLSRRRWDPWYTQWRERLDAISPPRVSPYFIARIGRTGIVHRDYDLDSICDCADCTYVRPDVYDAWDDMNYDVIGTGAFLPLRQGIRRYRLVIRCRKAVYLARFLQCRDVVHACLCSRGLRACVSPSAVDDDWCRFLLKRE